MPSATLKNHSDEPTGIVGSLIFFGIADETISSRTPRKGVEDCACSVTKVALSDPPKLKMPPLKETIHSSAGCSSRRAPFAGSTTRVFPSGTIPLNNKPSPVLGQKTLGKTV